MKPSGLVTHGRALHKFFVRKYRARDVAPDGLTVLPGRQPYFNGPVGRNLVVQEGNHFILKCIRGTAGPLDETNTFLGVGSDTTAPLRADKGLGGTYKYAAAEPTIKDGGNGEYYIESTASFGANDANFLWSKATLCMDADGLPTDDTVAAAINLGIALLESDSDLTKQSGEAWMLTSRFSVW